MYMFDIHFLLFLFLFVCFLFSRLKKDFFPQVNGKVILLIYFFISFGNFIKRYFHAYFHTNSSFISLIFPVFLHIFPVNFRHFPPFNFHLIFSFLWSILSILSILTILTILSILTILTIDWTTKLFFDQKWDNKEKIEKSEKYSRTEKELTCIVYRQLGDVSLSFGIYIYLSFGIYIYVHLFIIFVHYMNISCEKEIKIMLYFIIFQKNILYLFPLLLWWWWWWWWLYI